MKSAACNLNLQLIISIAAASKWDLIDTRINELLTLNKYPPIPRFSMDESMEKYSDFKHQGSQFPPCLFPDLPGLYPDKQ